MFKYILKQGNSIIQDGESFFPSSDGFIHTKRELRLNELPFVELCKIDVELVERKESRLKPKKRGK